MCGSMVDIRSVTTENRQGKKKKLQGQNSMSASATQGYHKYAFKYSAANNILCGVIADIVDVNKKMHPLTSDNKALSCALATEQPRLKPSGLFDLGAP